MSARVRGREDKLSRTILDRLLAEVSGRAALAKASAEPAIHVDPSMITVARRQQVPSQ
jgi:hypothetical protein